MTFPDDIIVTNDALVQDGMIIGDEPRKCWEASLREVDSIDSLSTADEETGTHSLLPTTIFLHSATGEGWLPSVTATADAEDLGSVKDVSSGPHTHPLINKLQDLQDVHSKGNGELQSAPPECSATDLGPHSALPPSPQDAWKAFFQSSPPMNVADFHSMAAAMIGTTFAATAAMDVTSISPLGSQENPNNFAAAGKYAKRMPDCRMGWQRLSATQGSQVQPEPLKVERLTFSPKPEDHNGRSKAGPASLGSLDQPFGCAPERKRVGCKGGCCGGAKCPKRHGCPSGDCPKLPRVQGLLRGWLLQNQAQDESSSSDGLLQKTLPGYSRDAANVLENIILMQIEKSATKVDVTGTPFLSEDEAIKVPIAEKSWATEIAQLQSINPTKTEASAQDKPESLSPAHLLEDIPSLGSMGHPLSCKSACKYNGKRSVSAQVKPDSFSQEHLHEEIPSLGSVVGHPLSYKSARKYSGESSFSAQFKPVSFSQEHLREDIPSLGSMGHPWSCNSACKYSGKRSGCKDGAKCDRCHLCRWSPKVNKKNAKSAFSLHALGWTKEPLQGGF